MSLLIDGYNLLYAIGLLGRPLGPGGLQRARLALLNFLAASLEPHELPHTTVVFDAAHPPWGLPRQIEHQGIHVIFADEGKDADTVIEEWLRHESAPRKLTVVSSDHRVQRAARRRRARAVDSDAWYAEVVAARQARQRAAETAAEPPPERAAVPLLAEDVDFWLAQFGGETALTRWIHESLEPELSADLPPAAADQPPADEPRDDDRAGKPLPGETYNPFPPGYGEDVAEEE